MHSLFCVFSVHDVDGYNEKEKVKEEKTTRSLLCRQEKGERGYIDYLGGIIDIHKKIIRTVGSPKRRFEEDYLRILRAIRFSCQLNLRLKMILMI